jgi:hypothetical protein
MNRNVGLNQRINLPINTQHINLNIQNAFSTIISELNSKDIRIKELEEKVNFLQSKLDSLQKNYQTNLQNNKYQNNFQNYNTNSPINENNNHLNNHINRINYENNEINRTPTNSTSSRAGTGNWAKIEVKKYLEEVKSRVNKNLFQKFVEKIRLLTGKKANHDKFEIINEVKILFGSEYYDLYEKLEKIIGKIE